MSVLIKCFVVEFECVCTKKLIVADTVDIAFLSRPPRLENWDKRRVVKVMVRFEKKSV